MGPHQVGLVVRHDRVTNDFERLHSTGVSVESCESSQEGENFTFRDFVPSVSLK